MLQSAKSIRHLKFSSRCSNYLLRSSYHDDALPKKAKLAPLQERKMVDKVKLYAKGGDGGNGCHSIHRSKRDGRGKPDGGNGGRGGDVILECSPTVWDFSSLQHHAIAGKGGHGTSKNMIGTRGSDKVVRVPVGTVIHLVKGEICNVAIETPASKDLDPWELPGTLTDTSTESEDPITKQTPSASSLSTGKATKESSVDRIALDVPSCDVYPGISTADSCSEEENETDEEEEMRCDVAELIKQGERIIICRGGEGGLGSVSLSKKPKPTNPDDNSQNSLRAGSSGSELTLVLELKSIADVSFVGIPNAGKSTLLGVISRAKPSVGDYAFTTLRPNLGNLNFDDLSITVADIPGLIKGAHEDRGLGHAFLRHIERTKVIAYVVDLAAALEGRKGISPWEQLQDLVSELEYHQEGLSDRPSLIVANKIDEEGAISVYDELKTRVKGVPIYPVCAVLEEGVPELKAGLRMLVDGGISESLKIDRILVD